MIGDKNYLQEKIKKYWDTQPCNIKHSSALIGTKEYFEEAEHRRYFVEPHIYEFCEFDKWKGKKVLEIGCGVGADAVNFIKHGAIYTGVDISSVSIDIARQRFEVYGLKGNLICEEVENLLEIFPAESFDLVYSMGVLHHTVNPKQSFKIAAALTKHIFKGMVYATNSWKKFLIQAGLDQYEAQSGVPIAKTYTEKELYTLLTDFEFVSVEQTHVFPWKIPEYKQYKYVKEPWFEAMSPEIFNVFKNNLGWHLLFEGIK